MEDMDVGFEEFAAAFDGDDGYQTETTEEPAETETTEETTEEAQSEPESGEESEEDHTGDSEENGAKGSEDGDGGKTEQKFTIKVNKESREVSLEEMTELAQKGADYDRVRQLCEKLASDVQAGMSLTSAYLKQENARKDAEIAELQRKQAAADQNKRNRSKSPGSQRDAGGRKAKTDFDEFAEAYE